MRILLSEESKIKLFNFLKEKENCNSLKKLANLKNIPLKTLQSWLYEKGRYFPESFIPSEIKNNLEIIDKKENNWGKIKGGEKTYQIILKKYGIEEIRKRQSNGGKRAAHLIKKRQEPIVLDLNNSAFLELYGVLLGDGWLSKLNYKGKTIWLIGVSGNGTSDRDFFSYLKNNIHFLFKRVPYQKERPNYNSIELNFSHKMLVAALNKELDFPIGKKINLKIHPKIYVLGYDKVKHVIRGIFDTDGCFYLDKTPVGRPYPCISLTMKAPILMKQVHDLLLSEGFKVYHYHSNKIDKIILKGSIQVRKWLKEIGSSNPYKHAKMQKALVAQPG